MIYTWKSEIHRESASRVLLALRFGRDAATGSRAIAVAAVNFEPGTPVLDGQWALQESFSRIRDWAVYIGATTDPDEYRDEEERAITLDYVARYGIKASEAVGTALFPSLPPERWRL